MKIADLTLLLPAVTNGWSLAALVAILVYLYATRKKD